MTSYQFTNICVFAEKCGSRVVLGDWTVDFGKMPTVKPNERRVALLKDWVCECAYQANDFHKSLESAHV